MRIVPWSTELREWPSYQALRDAWPEFLLHDAVSNERWGRLFSEFPEFQFVAVEDGEAVAKGSSIPVNGTPAAWRDAFLSEGEPDRLCALEVLIASEHHGRGFSRPMLEYMRGLAAARGWELVAPVRPTWKARYPLTPIERYAGWRRADGLLYDPWLRAHERLGAEVTGTAPAAMVVSGSVAEWEHWTGMVFPDSGSYVVPRALVPVEIDRERDTGLYVEPCVWMRHRA
jgi:GNAT superfamily N-acetyltransferase